MSELLRRLPWSVALTALALPLVLWAAVNSIRLALAPGAEYTGIFRYDLFYYLQNAREVVEAGNGLFYDNPSSAAIDGPRVYSHLQLVLFGWTWWLTGLPLTTLWQSGQVVFGCGMFLALYRLLGSYFSDRERLAAFALLSVGGGGVVLQSLWVSASPGAPPFLDTFRFFISDTKGAAWLPNVYQNALFTTEAFYHLLAFSTLSCMARGQRAWTLLGVFLSWWTHPFTGLEVGAIVGAAAVFECFRQRSAANLRFAAAVAVLSGAFVFYYIVLIPALSTEAAYILEHWRVDITIFHFRDAWAMWGLFLLGPLLLLRMRTLLDLRGSGPDRLLAAWLVVVPVLILHDLLLPESIDAFQPLHFSRGYLFVAMGILLLRGLSRLTRGWPPQRRALALAGLIAIGCADNVVYTANLVNVEERPVLSRDLLDISQHLAAQDPPTNLFVDGAVPLLPGYLPIVTQHTTYLGHLYLTPFYPEKAVAIQQMIASESPARIAAQLGIGFAVGTKALEHAFAADLAAGRARLSFSAGPYRVIEILLPKVPQAPGPPPPLH